MDKELLIKLEQLIGENPELKNQLEQMVKRDEHPVGITEKIKYLMTHTGHRIKDLQEPMQVGSPAAVNKKLAESRFPFQEIIRIVEYLGGSITVKVGDIEMQFTEEDL